MADVPVGQLRQLWLRWQLQLTVPLRLFVQLLLLLLQWNLLWIRLFVRFLMLTKLLGRRGAVERVIA